MIAISEQTWAALLGAVIGAAVGAGLVHLSSLAAFRRERAREREDQARHARERVQLDLRRLRKSLLANIRVVEVRRPSLERLRSAYADHHFIRQSFVPFEMYMRHLSPETATDLSDDLFFRLHRVGSMMETLDRIVEQIVPEARSAFAAEHRDAKAEDIFGFLENAVASQLSNLGLLDTELEAVLRDLGTAPNDIAAVRDAARQELSAIS